MRGRRSIGQKWFKRRLRQAFETIMEMWRRNKRSLRSAYDLHVTVADGLLLTLTDDFNYAKLKPADDMPTIKADIAKLSWLNHQFKEDEHAKNKQCEWKQRNGPHKSKCTNWQAPFLWPSIDAAARNTFPQYSPTKIVRHLHHENYKA